VVINMKLMKFKYTLPEADFIVFKGRDGRVYAKDGETGQIVAEDDKDLGVVLQEVVNRIPDAGAGVIYIKPGVYTMYTGVRAAKAGLAIIGGYTWDVGGGVNDVQYGVTAGTVIDLVTDGIKYFDFGYEDPEWPTRGMRVVVMGLGAYAGDPDLYATHHTDSIFIYLRNRVRQSLFRQLFIVNTGYGIVGEKTMTESKSLQDVYFENLAFEHQHYKGIEIRSGEYNIVFQNVYGGWNKVDAPMFHIKHALSVRVDNLWILSGTYRALALDYCHRVFVKNTIIDSVRGANAIATADSSYVMVDGVIIDTADNYSPYYLFAIWNSPNLQIRNVYARYYNNIMYLEGTMPRMFNCRFYHTTQKVEYRSENSGTATIVGDGSTTVFEVDVPHGLVSDKVSAKVTTTRPTTAPPSYLYAYLVDNDNDGFMETLRITIKFDTPPAEGEQVNIYWSAEVVG